MPYLCAIPDEKALILSIKVLLLLIHSSGIPKTAQLGLKSSKIISTSDQSGSPLSMDKEANGEAVLVMDCPIATPVFFKP